MSRLPIAFKLLGPVGLLLAVALQPAAAQEDEDSPYRPGLVANYAASGQAATRLDEVVAFDWQGAAGDERLPAGPFSAAWRGRLWTKTPGSYTLACYVQGAVTIKLAGKPVVTGTAEQSQWLTSQPLTLEFDHHELEIEFRRTQPQGQLALFWSGPDFRLEPVPARALWHDRVMSPASDFERGRQLAAALRCAACHADSSGEVAPAPALDRLSGNIHEPWLVDWLAAHGNETPQATVSQESASARAPRRMPHFAITRGEAAAIAAWLLREPADIRQPQSAPASDTRSAKSSDKTKKSGTKTKKGQDEKPRPSAGEGEKLLLSRGCLACHTVGEYGESGLFGGGDLTRLVAKRPAGFLLRWLADPAAINRLHRMPVFTFTADEMESLRLWEQEQAKKVSIAQSGGPSGRRELIEQGERLVNELRCGSCHVLSRDRRELAAARVASLTAASNWQRSCGGAPSAETGRPGFELSAADRAALKAYFSEPRPGLQKLSPQARGRNLLVELNCLACHQREGIDRSVAGTLRAAVADRHEPGGQTELPSLQERLTAVAQRHGDLAPLVPAMTPPALNSVGDKLHDSALAAAISRAGPPHRPYLLVQMPTFRLEKEQLDALVAYFVATDRIPGGAPHSSPHAPREEPLRVAGAPGPGIDAQSETATALAAAGPRLVTTDGLSCTSCHQVGSVLPVKAPLNARGPDLSMLEKRIRREWFDRWCADPARIVPRMEMPSVKVPVRGVLNDNVELQLAAVWQILNTPGFEPPEPDPVRVLRLSGIPEKNERPIVIHDVVKDGDKTYLYPLVIGLPNRHNILLDLETNRLAAWWLGDTARQRTKGKSWYWEMGGKSLLDACSGAEVSIIVNNHEHVPVRKGQFTAVLDSARSQAALPQHPPAVRTSYRLYFDRIGELINERLWVEEDFRVPSKDNDLEPSALLGDFERTMTIGGAPTTCQFRFRLVSPSDAQDGSWNPANQTFSGPQGRFWIRINAPSNVQWNGDGTFTWPGGAANVRRPVSTVNWRLTYGSAFPVDQYIANPQRQFGAVAKRIDIAPGFSSHILPLENDIMPSGFAWLSDGRLAFSTLKGQVFLAKDSDNNGLENELSLVIDGLATPYGLCVDDLDRLLVAAKTGLLSCDHLERTDLGTGFSFRASGWGYTEDYHDWAVGPVVGKAGELYIALPCQQDQRSHAAAALRGRLVQLGPHHTTVSENRSYDIVVVSAGHRFPMGLARNRDGELFVTDNQGNYNPFNELNHVRKGAHFGFINALEKEKGYKPPRLDEPAINIPHPWTRSVNGICFLDTPEALRRVGSAYQAGAQGGTASAKDKVATAHPSIYGPIEGHLVGCEYDTRRLIRMSLQRIGDTFQGCAYPLSIPTDDVEKGLLGPIVCAIKPTTGELYVGEIRDSGWGAGNNIGQIVKIKVEPQKFPCGIAEVRATSTGFTIDFFQPVDRAKAADVTSYSIESYRRESTPAYGGPDLDRRTERISAAAVSADGKRVTLTLPELRTGHVFEFHLKNLAPGGGMFHPDEAHYTLHKIPQAH